MWSIGTIFVELILRVPFLSGESDIDQLKKTFHAMGSPTEEDWPVSTGAIILTPGPYEATRLSRDTWLPKESLVEYDSVYWAGRARVREGVVAI